MVICAPGHYHRRSGGTEVPDRLFLSAGPNGLQHESRLLPGMNVTIVAAVEVHRAVDRLNPLIYS